MFRKLDDFMQAYGYLSESSGKIFATLTDENIQRAVADGHRTLGGMAWHIVTSTVEMMQRTGLSLSTIDAESTPPASAVEIQQAYRAVSKELADTIRKTWTDETLLTTDDMYGEQWERGKTLAILIHHEIHHRGQMTVLLRQAGEKLPGVFGPSKEEWGQFGMETPIY